MGVYPVGRTRVTLNRDNLVIDLDPPPTKHCKIQTNHLLASDSRLRPDSYALEKSDFSKSGYEKSRLLGYPVETYSYQ
ncbi:hypothetical protein MLD38_037478 [Melastoma candidum]|uniref:Uncharacterized protein n=1 Tax=Melastoma candidum TaxID=119954 RepID=A0ACB9LM75_9MYRT|nr:hypothetical protein MLD38_037478 [Melastoma candidum]